jgi:hypothetical protein
MNLSTKTQVPEYLLISPIDRNGQDLELLGFDQGHAFCGSRIPGKSILDPEKFSFLVGAPAEYNHHFPFNKAVVLTFDWNEPMEIISTTIQNVAKIPQVQEVPIVALKVNYEDGLVEVVQHGGNRSEAIETELASKAVRPSAADRDVLVFTCSDSRIVPPRTTHGLSMNLRSIGGFVPTFSGSEDETAQFNSFLENWLLSKPKDRRMVLLAHGSHDHGGAVCGGAKASLDPSGLHEGTLKSVVKTLQNEGLTHEAQPHNNPNTRALALDVAIKKNLLTYPAISKAVEAGFDAEKQIDIAFIDTVTGCITGVNLQ